MSKKTKVNTKQEELSYLKEKIKFIKKNFRHTTEKIVTKDTNKHEIEMIDNHQPSLVCIVEIHMQKKE